MDSNMMKWIGKEVRIKEISRSSVYFEETGSYGWNPADIESAVEGEFKDSDSAYCIKSEELAAIAITLFEPERVILDKNIVIIHYPEIKITNTARSKHTIRDMYISIGLSTSSDKDKKIAIAFNGIRSTFTLEEAESRYMHSHISTGSFLTWSPFCMGTTPFKMMLMNLEFDPTVDNWELFLLSIQKFLEWESKEGTPYINMTSIKIGRNTPPVNLEDNLKDIIAHIPNDCLIFDTKPQFNETKSFIDWINDHSRIRSLSAVDPAGIQNLYERKVKEIEMTYGTYIQIGSKKVPLTIIAPEFDKEALKKKPVDKNIVEGYKKILNNYCNKYENLIAYDREKSVQQTFGEIGII